MTTAIADLRQHLLDLLLQFAYQEGDFVLSSGQKSTYYINSKQVTLRADGALTVGRLLWTMLPPDTHAVGGLTLGADPMVTAVSLVSELEAHPIPALIVRKQPKGHGTKAYIEGPNLPAGANVVVLEDVVTTGQSALQAVGQLRNAGYTVTKIMALVDREQGGQACYAAEGVEFEAIFSIRDLQAAAQSV